MDSSCLKTWAIIFLPTKNFQRNFSIPFSLFAAFYALAFVHLFQELQNERPPPLKAFFLSRN